MRCMKCKKIFEDHPVFSKPQIESYTVREIKKVNIFGEISAVTLEADICNSCMKKIRLRHACAKRGLGYWFLFCIVFFLGACALVWLFSGGDGSLAQILTFPYILIPLIPLWMTPLVIWLRYRHPLISFALNAEGANGKSVNTAEELASLSYKDLLREIRMLRQRLDAWRGEDGEKAHDSMNQEARIIGEELNRRGGKALMLQAHRDADAGRAIEFAWDGVGDWRG